MQDGGLVDPIPKGRIKGSASSCILYCLFIPEQIYGIRIKWKSGSGFGFLLHSRMPNRIKSVFKIKPVLCSLVLTAFSSLILKSYFSFLPFLIPLKDCRQVFIHQFGNFTVTYF